MARSPFCIAIVMAAAWIWFCPASVFAQVASEEKSDPTPGQLMFFETRIRPVLAEHCYGCHSQDAANKGKLKGNLFLDSRDGMLRGGDTGPALFSGRFNDHANHQPGESLILKALRYEEYEMPPSGRLPQSVIDDFERWIADGAVDPRREAQPIKQRAMDLEAGRRFWSLQPLQTVVPPGDSHPVDAFIRESLAKKQLRQSPVADARVLVRRAWFDLLGIPPTPEELEQAVQSLEVRSGESGLVSSAAWGELIDRLLARPEYGERWARHWMDVARFAESFGYEQDYDRPHAFHYRDFLIRAFNEDMPFDRFAQWQIAGDELAPHDPLAWMATGFLGAGAFPTQLTEREFESTRYNELDDMTATTGVAFLGLSIGCARCHDHKFDPITSEDYYRFASAFTAVIRSEKTFDLHPEENEKIKAQYTADLEQARHDIASFEATGLVTELTRALRDVRSRASDRTASDSNHSAGATSPWRIVSGEIEASAGSQFQSQPDGSYLAIGDAPNQETVIFTARIPAGEWSAIRIEALADSSLPRQGPGRAGNGNFALGHLVVEHLHDASDGPAANGNETNVIPLVLDQPRATHEQNGDTLSVAASIDTDPVSGWAVDGQIGKSQAAVFHLASALKSGLRDRMRFTLRFHHPNPKHAIGRMRFSVSTQPMPPVEVGSNDAPTDVVEAIESLADAITDSEEPSEAIRSSEAWSRAIAWYKSTSPTWKELRARLAKLEKDGPALHLSKILVTTEGEPHVPHHADDRGYPHFYPETHLLRRGDVEQKVSVVTPGVPRVFVRHQDQSSDLRWETLEKRNPKSSYRRAALARWLTDTEAGSGALVARVIANRLWQHHFGRGLVTTPNDFGSTGELPSHPELLEWLAQDLIHHEWKLKPLHKRIMTSETYMQGNRSADDPRMTSDPDNQLWWFRPPRRLEAEAVRDSLLAVSGTLDRTMYGPGTL
ncbi:MAG: PSD1 and planctomycete cytochrome C domain-containing protein, partial [Planctomycetota bacterium]